jgi:putative addiction module component (TIGR02574 family)
MTRAELQSQILQLPVEDRLELAEALWESLKREPVQPELPAWQREALDERLAADDAAPEAGSPWEEVKQRILSSLSAGPQQVKGRAMEHEVEETPWE